jgi:hypothetical protein
MKQKRKELCLQAVGGKAYTARAQILELFIICATRYIVKNIDGVLV